MNVSGAISSGRARRPLWATAGRNKKSNDRFVRLSLMFYRAPLDWLNFFLADVRGGLGAYVGVFLLTQAHWNQATIGAVLTVSGLIGITLHAPIGALIDATNYKRGLIIVGTCALAATHWPSRGRPPFQSFSALTF